MTPPIQSDNQTSRELFDRARQVMPGGVSSPVRAFQAVGGDPLFLEKAFGAHVQDVDGNRYLDFVGSWGPLILGHAHPEVLAEVTTTAAAGTTFGAPHAGEVDLASLIVECYPGVEQVRFTSSGTEATMSAIRLARGVTGRSRLLKFSGCYHGHADGLLVAAGSGAVTLGEPSSAGVPPEVAALTSVLPLDADAALEDYFAAHGAETAAVIVEPMPANNGLLLQRPEFLQRLRALTQEHGVLLIFDEVISGFRVAQGGAAEVYGITPDLATFGKIIGGGMPCGAFAGKAEHFRALAPQGPVYHAGTLSGNPLAMAAGLRTLQILRERDAWFVLDEKGARFEAALAPHLADRPVCIVRQGSVFWLCFGAAVPPRDAESIAPAAAELYAKFFRSCLGRGLYLAPSAYEVGFLSLVHTDAELDRAAAAMGAALDEVFA